MGATGLSVAMEVQVEDVVVVAVGTIAVVLVESAIVMLVVPSPPAHKKYSLS